MKETELSCVTGMVEQIIFKNEETGFCVLELGTDDALLTVVGELAAVDAGEELTVYGAFGAHPVYGRQFKAQAFERRLPDTANAIYKYLASGVVKGIGGATARKIVDMFGDETLERIEADPMCLAAVPGISEQKAKTLARAFQELFGARQVMIFLEKYGILSGQSVKVWKKWGTFSIDYISGNPYVLCQAEIEVPFGVADQMAESLGFSGDDDNRIRAGLEYVLRHNLNNGHTSLPRDQLVSLAMRLLALDEAPVARILEEEIEARRFYRVSRAKDFIYLPEFYLAEKEIARKLRVMLGKQESVYDDVDALISLEEQNTAITYAERQKEAIRKALLNRVMILTGGPGTGKTTTLNAIIDLFEQGGLSVLIAAPTGRAAKRISELTGREAKTIHRLLGVEQMAPFSLQFVHNERNPLDCDALVIDEMSMVDTLLFDRLLKGVRPDCRLILTGDADQLPSVGAGNVLRDLIGAGCIPTVELKEIFRQAAESLIVTNAHAIVKGEMPDLSQKDRDFFFLSRGGFAECADTVAELVCSRLPASYGYQPAEDIQVLCPSRKGPVGTVALNKCLQESLNPPAKGKDELSVMGNVFRAGDKVMQVRNNYDVEWRQGSESGTGLYNGDIGIVKRVDKLANCLTLDFDGKVAVYPADLIKEIELAYAVTVHKSQGNEFKAVVIPVMPGYAKLYYRNLLYTAVTRAKELLILVGSAQQVARMVRETEKSLRYTGLKYFLQTDGGA